LTNSHGDRRPYDEMFELAFAFLANPWNVWVSPHLEHKRAVLKLAFQERLAYRRSEGFRTPQLTEPFTFLGNLNQKL